MGILIFHKQSMPRGNHPKLIKLKLPVKNATEAYNMKVIVLKNNLA